MSDRGDTREQPSIPEPDPLGIEHLFLAVAIVAFTVSLVALLVEHNTQLALLRGGYSILAALMVVGVVSYFGIRVLRDLAVVKAQRLEVRQMLRYREVMRQRRAVGEPVSVGGPRRSSSGGDRVNYWTVYADVLEDLGGIDDQPSEN